MEDLKIIVNKAVYNEMLSRLDSCLFLDGIYDRIREEISEEDCEKFEEEIDLIVADEIDELKQFLSTY